MRAWRRLLRDRPTGLPAPGPATDGAGTTTEKRRRAGRSGYASAPRRPIVSNGDNCSTGSAPAGSLLRLAQASIPIVKDIQIVPPVPSLRSLCLGLFPLSKSMDALWQDEFHSGYTDSIDKTVAKIKEYLHRWTTWANLGRLHDGSKRIVCFTESIVDALGGAAAASFVEQQIAGEPDEVFRRFCTERGLVSVEPGFVPQIISALERKKDSFVLCTVPDCSGFPGIAHLSLAAGGGTGAVKETQQQREAREKAYAEQEDAERLQWRRPKHEHRAGCGHLASRDAWEEED